MHSCPHTTQWSNPTIAPYRIALPQDLKRYSWYGAQFHNGRLVPGSQESANRRCRNVLTTGNPEVVSGSFVPASGSRPEHECRGMSRALAVEMRADFKASMAARM
jgi:hypothetical protein